MPSTLEIEIVQVESATVLFVRWTTAPPRLDRFRLTPAETEVLEAIAQGKGNAEIARSRGTSLRTIANQAASLFRKVGVFSRHELVSRIAASGERSGV